MTRVAAVGDLHIGEGGEDQLTRALASVEEQADVLLLAGDLTRCGDIGEVTTLGRVLEPLEIPVVAVLGNHDHHAGRVDELVLTLTRSGVEILEGTSTVLALNGTTVGVAGTKGFGGGFAGASVSEFGEPVTKAFARYAASKAEHLEVALGAIAEADVRIALLHYAPIPETLRGENPQLFPFLGSHLLSEAIDRAGADLVLHGHAHHGSEHGLTPRGIRVRNVAQPVICRAYRIFELPHGDDAVSSVDRAA